MTILKQNEKHSYRLEIVLLSLIVICYLAQTVVFGSRLVNFPLDLISVYHSYNIPRLYDAIASQNPAHILAQITSLCYPPMQTALHLLNAQIFNRSITAVIAASNLPYLLMLIIFGYLLGKRLLDRVTGILFAIFVSLLPMAYGAASTVSLDFPMMGLASMCVYMLLRSESFNSTKWSVLFAISLGWGMMTKETFLLYVIGPMVYSLAFGALSDGGPDKKKYMKNIVLAAGITLAIDFIYYCLPGYGRSILVTGMMTEYNDIPWYSVESLRLFTLGLSESQLTPPFFLVFLAGLWYFAKSASSPLKKYLILWILVPNMVVMLMPHWKTARYLMPVLPALALVAALGARKIMVWRFGKALVALAVAAGIAQYFVINFMESRYITHEEDSIDSGPVYYSYTDASLPYRVKAEKSARIKRIYESIAKITAPAPGKSEYSLFIPCYVESVWNIHFMKDYLWFNNMPLPEELDLVYSGLDGINEAAKDPDKYDSVLFSVTKERQSLIKQGYLSLEVLIACYQDTMRFHAGNKGDEKLDMKQLEISWNRITSVFSVRTLAYEDEKIAIYYYRKPPA